MRAPVGEYVTKVLSFIRLGISQTGTGVLGWRLFLLPAAGHKFKWIQDMSINTVIDVGAHKGQSALEFHELFPHARIYSFEPLLDCYLQLNARMKNVPNFRSFNLALGDMKGILTMHRSEFSPSSSLLKMANLHKEAFPYSAGEIQETVDVNTLDNMTRELDLEDDILLKIDVQGWEHKVLIGSRSLLKRIRVIVVEASFQELYEGQPLFGDIYDLLFSQGFVYSGTWAELRSPLDGAPLQQDSIFIRK